MEIIYIDPMETNKNLVESFVMATVRNGYGIYAQRTIVRLIEASQSMLEGKRVGDCVKYQIDLDLFGHRRIRMPITAILADGDTTNYTTAKKEIKRLVQLPLEYEDSKTWLVVPLLSRVEFDKLNGDAILEVQPEVWQAMFDFSMGWRKFELTKALKLKSTYSVRLYQLLSMQEKPISYSLDNLKKMLGVENKYPRPIDFIKRIIIPAKEELDQVAPYSFDFKPILERKTTKGRAGITGVTFFPKFIAKNEDRQLAEKNEFDRIEKNYPQVVALPQGTENYMIHALGFTKRGLTNNKELLLDACKKIPEFDSFLRGLVTNARKAKNPQGYILNAIKSELESLSNKE